MVQAVAAGDGSPVSVPGEGVGDGVAEGLGAAVGGGVAAPDGVAAGVAEGAAGVSPTSVRSARYRVSATASTTPASSHAHKRLRCFAMTAYPRSRDRTGRTHTT